MHLHIRSNVKEIIPLIFLFISFFSLTDFALYYFPVLKVLYWLLVSSCFVLVVLYSKKIDKLLLFYLFIFCLGYLIIVLANQSANGVLLVPILAYMCFCIQRQNKYGVDLYKFSLLIIIFLIGFSFIEIFVKLKIIQIPLMVDYLTNTGAKRIDVLRARGPFGSPLSLSAAAVYLSFYSLYIRKSLLCYYGSVIIVLLSGSRTALVLCFLLFLSTVLLRKISIKKFGYAIFITGIMVFIVFYYVNKLGLTGIMSRVFSVQNYNLARDDSFQGRRNTTVYTVLLILEQMPRTFFLPLGFKHVADSAIVSMIAGSGLFLVLGFFFLLLWKIFSLKIKQNKKLMFFFLITILALMVGDAFVPAVSFYLFSVLYKKI